MELIAQAYFTMTALACSICAALLCVIFRPVRRFCLAVLVTPPFAVFSLLFMRWGVNDSAPVCGPNLEWDRCPSITARIIGWTVWLTLVIGLAVTSYFMQRVVRTGASSFLFRNSPTTLFGNTDNLDR